MMMPFLPAKLSERPWHNTAGETFRAKEHDFIVFYADNVSKGTCDKTGALPAIHGEDSATNNILPHCLSVFISYAVALFCTAYYRYYDFAHADTNFKVSAWAFYAT